MNKKTKFIISLKGVEIKRKNQRKKILGNIAGHIFVLEHDFGQLLGS